MIGLISSTIFPLNNPGADGARTWIRPEQRIEQTQRTIASLRDVGITDIHLVDNSGALWRRGTEQQFAPAKVYVYDHHQYKNKGTSELWLLLSALENLPPDTPILKISGRYGLTKGIDFDGAKWDLAGRIYRLGIITYSFSTRCYVIKSKEVYETFIKRTLMELYGYSARIVGPRSFYRILRNSFLPKYDRYPYDDPGLSIENAAAHVIRKYGYRFDNKEYLGVQGVLGEVQGISINE